MERNGFEGMWVASAAVSPCYVFVDVRRSVGPWRGRLPKGFDAAAGAPLVQVAAPLPDIAEAIETDSAKLEMLADSSDDLSAQVRLGVGRREVAARLLELATGRRPTEWEVERAVESRCKDHAEGVAPRFAVSCFRGVDPELQLGTAVWPWGRPALRSLALSALATAEGGLAAADDFVLFAASRAAAGDEGPFERSYRFFTALGPVEVELTAHFEYPATGEAEFDVCAVLQGTDIGIRPLQGDGEGYAATWQQAAAAGPDEAVLVTAQCIAMGQIAGIAPSVYALRGNGGLEELVAREGIVGRPGCSPALADAWRRAAALGGKGPDLDAPAADQMGDVAARCREAPCRAADTDTRRRKQGR